jgi:hypothetical protein
VTRRKYFLLGVLCLGSCTPADQGNFVSIERSTTPFGEYGFSCSTWGVDKRDRSGKKFLYQLIYVLNNKPDSVTQSVRDGVILTVEGRNFNFGSKSPHCQFSWNRVLDDVGKFSLDGETVVSRNDNNLFVFKVSESGVEYDFLGYSENPITETQLLERER